MSAYEEIAAKRKRELILESKHLTMIILALATVREKGSSYPTLNEEEDIEALRNEIALFLGQSSHYRIEPL